MDQTAQPGRQAQVIPWTEIRRLAERSGDISEQIRAEMARFHRSRHPVILHLRRGRRTRPAA